MPEHELAKTTLMGKLLPMKPISVAIGKARSDLQFAGGILRVRSGQVFAQVRQAIAIRIAARVETRE